MRNTCAREDMRSAGETAGKRAAHNYLCTTARLAPLVMSEPECSTWNSAAPGL